MADQAQPRVVVVGSVNQDSVITCPHLPQPGETVEGLSHTWGLGGKGANQAAAASHAGGSVCLIGAVGSDPAGQSLREVLISHNVDVSHLAQVPEVPTGIAHIHVREDGENHIVIDRGANGRVVKIEPEHRAAIAQADVLLLQLEIPSEGVLAAARAARDAGVPVILTPAPARQLPSELLECVSVLVPNRVELEQLTGSSDPVQAAKALAGHGLDVVVTLGSEGSMWVSPAGDVKSVPAHRVPVLDSTGAGDCFTGAFAVAWATHQDTLAAMRMATAAAGLSVQVVGAAASMPFRNAIEAALGTEVAV